MSQSTTIDYAEAAFDDMDRLSEFLAQQDSPLSAQLAAFIVKAVTVLVIQPGIGRPVGEGHRELIIHRGRSGYLVRYRYNRDQNIVTVLRIRHQSESGYTADEI